MALLEIGSLTLSFGETAVLRKVDLALEAGEVLGVVGESGSGKSLTALTVMKLLPRGAQVGGSVLFDGIDILSAPEPAMCRLRGDDIGMVFQEPMTALNPVKTIGEQVAEGIRFHTGANRSDAERRARAMLDRVGLPAPRFGLDRYPHELSGGQRQRVVIAIACALNPKLLIADEPTTALDVVLQAQILELLKDLVDERRMALMLISHDLAVVAGMADRIAVMRDGSVVDKGPAADLLSERRHPYTRQLAEASTHVPARRRPADPRLPAEVASTAPARASASPSEPLLVVRDLSKNYPGRRRGLFGRSDAHLAVDGVSLTIAEGESVALVGRSGCGKSTLARMVLALDAPTSGAIRLDGEPVSGLPDRLLASARRKMQVVFQDPYGSFDPRQRVETLVAEPLHLDPGKPSREERRERVAHALSRVGLSAADMQKYPHEFSGGQRQRIAIARAIITAPKLIVADEPVSALDVSIRAQVLDLFAELNGELGVAYLFITHDLHVARAVTDRILVMDEGRIVEEGSTGAILDSPQSDAARRLVASAPDLGRALAARLATARKK